MVGLLLNITREVRSYPGLLAFLVLAVFFSDVPSALSQSSYELSNRINRIENEIETLSRAVYRGDVPAGDSSYSGAAPSADVEVRLQQIERELRDLVGMVEKQSYEVRQLRQDMERITSDLELRMNDLDGSSANIVGQQPSSNSSSRYTTKPLSRNEQTDSGEKSDSYSWSSRPPSEGQLGSYVERSDGGVFGGDEAASLYESAFSLVKNRQFGGAESGFKNFLEKYPDHALAGNAKYWLGETYYVRGKFDQAARIFAEGYQSYPDGAKAADNLLKLGMSLAGLGKTEDACTALAQLDSGNVKASGPVKRRATQEKERLGC